MLLCIGCAHNSPYFQVFKEWHAKKYNTKREEKAALDKERQKKGILNGREIFLQTGFTATDDASASEEYSREIDTEIEEREMRAKAEEAIAASKTNAGSISCCFGSALRMFWCKNKSWCNAIPKYID